MAARSSSSYENWSRTPTAYEEVVRANSLGRLWSPSATELTVQLALLKNRSIEEVQEALLGQYKIGLKLKRRRFVDELWSSSAQIVPREFLEKCMGVKPRPKPTRQPLGPSTSVNCGPFGARDFRFFGTEALARQASPVRESMQVDEFPPLPHTLASAPNETTNEAQVREVTPEPPATTSDKGPENVSGSNMTPIPEIEVTDYLSPIDEESLVESSDGESDEPPLAAELPDSGSPEPSGAISRGRGHPLPRDRSRSPHHGRPGNPQIKSAHYAAQCPIKSCERARNLRRHVNGSHLPLRFRKENLNRSELHDPRMEGLSWLAERVGANTLEDLQHWINQTGSIPRNVQLGDGDHIWVKQMCIREGWEFPQTLSLVPINCVALLAHWRAIMSVLVTLSPGQRSQFYRLDRHPGALKGRKKPTVIKRVKTPSTTKQPKPLGRAQLPPNTQQYQSVPTLVFTNRARTVTHSTDPNRPLVITTRLSSTPVIPLMDIVLPRPPQSDPFMGVDSHFHPDRTMSKLSARGRNVPVKDLIRTVIGTLPDPLVTISGEVRVHCDPATLPTDLECVEGVRYAIGLHPKKASSLNDTLFGRIESLLRNPCVTALGEVGIDHTEPQESWGVQERALVRLLSLSCPGRPLVLHLRDHTAYATHARIACMNILREQCARYQKIHVHCFTGTADHIGIWIDSFPNVYFGVTGLAAEFDSMQQEAVRRIPPERLLLETDSPYLRIKARGINTPAYLGEVAEVIGKIRGETLKHVLDTTSRNARELYRF